jgi:hypothetical protein
MFCSAIPVIKRFMFRTEERMKPLDDFLAKTLPKAVMNYTPKYLRFAGWCQAKCKPGKGCKWRRQPGMTWRELMKLCPKRSKEG